MTGNIGDVNSTSMARRRASACSTSTVSATGTSSRYSVRVSNDSRTESIAILKARILAGDWDGAESDARWTLEQDAADAESSIGRYAATLALLVLGRDEEARVLADGLRTRDDFPQPVGDALAYIAAEDPLGYIDAIEAVLESFETREDYLEDLPAADTVVVFQALAARRDMAAELSSPLLPSS